MASPTGISRAKLRARVQALAFRGEYVRTGPMRWRESNPKEVCYDPDTSEALLDKATACPGCGRVWTSSHGQRAAHIPSSSVDRPDVDFSSGWRLFGQHGRHSHLAAASRNHAIPYPGPPSQESRHWQA